MSCRLLADLLVLLHLGFIGFVLFGGFLVLWRRWIFRLHLVAVAWGVLIEWAGWICPLTPWEQMLRERAGQVGYGGGFIEHYLLPLIYPDGLTPWIQLLLGIVVLLWNLGVYAFVRARLRFARLSAGKPGETPRMGP